MIDFTRVKNDVNGNPRYVCHFLDFIDSCGIDSGIPLNQKYNLALDRSRKFGGKKFHNKQYGGGIVFQEYDIYGLSQEIEQFMADLKSGK